MDSEALSTLSLSATWKTNRQPVRFWRRELEMGALTMLRSGLTCAPSTQNRGAAAYISLLAGRPAHPSASPEKKGEKTTKGIYSPTSSESQPDLDTQASFWKMLEPPAATTSTPYDPNFERWVTQLRKESSVRQRRALHIRESDSSSWPTPASRDWKGFDSPGKQNTKSDPKMYLSIPQAPATTKDGLGSSTDGPSLPQPSAKNHRCSTKCRRLNANFAAHLMGLPKNYLLKSCCVESAMESFQQWQHSLSENSRTSNHAPL